MTTKEQPTTRGTGAATTQRQGSPEVTTTPAAGSTRPVVGRIPVLDVAPAVDAGRWPSKAVVGELVPVTATVFREGHDAVAATAVLVRPDGTDGPSARMTLTNAGTDRYAAVLSPDAEGDWGLRVDGWSDPYGTWDHDATIKVGAGVDVALMLEEGARLLERAAGAPGRDEEGAQVLRAAVDRLRDTSLGDAERLAAGTSEQVRTALDRLPVREMVSPSPTLPLRVERRLAAFSSWYEFFPRSEGAYFDDEAGRWVSGTFRTAAERLPAIADMGFDIAYLVPVHPIGTTNRKGPNNTLNAGPLDPGSPYAIGAADGGHDALHPELGTFEDFDFFVARAKELGLEVALDLALQCSPDHPWVTEHPEWFTTRADGTIAYAENPPKKYQDIYPLNFDNDPEGIYAEVKRVVDVWISHGVTCFRVDNPHTKPVEFWEWLIGEVNREHPEVVWLSEAFTKPAMMNTLAKVGFQQSYSYFAWRNAGWEIREYLEQLTTESAHYMRPSFWPTTHDILTPTMQYGGPPVFKLRAVLAALLSPSWGIYSGYELVEHAARPGAEEQLDNEKYQFRPRDWARAEREGWSLAPYLKRLNEVRRAHPALQELRGTVFHPCDDENVLAFSRRRVALDGTEDLVLVVVNLDPHATRETTVHLDMAALGRQWWERFPVRDELTGATYEWGEHDYVRLDPYVQPAHVFHVLPHGAGG
ncbi:alpha-1,4-glucan--maltose-1-phosphate maltosyltransferase [Kineococcus auxinigenes]|uniref:alpha-1,4-glucan--maltose-1-phosphate maltosyltransferase n=1 Tax=unclassified Kineococcus TaxID=2621656 RepID=UPI003D7D3348